MEGEEKVYQRFLKEKISQDLIFVNRQRQLLDEEIHEYETVRLAIHKLQKSDVNANLKTKVDLGCDFYVNANVPNPHKIFVKAIHGFFIEFTWDEALTFIEKKINLLKDRADYWRGEYCRINASATFMQSALDELQSLKLNENS